MAEKKSAWKRLFGREGDEAPAPAPPAAPPAAEVPEAQAPAAPGAPRPGQATGYIVADALRNARYTSAAGLLAMRGRTEVAGDVGEMALKAGRYEQAAQVFEHLGLRARAGEAYRLAARDVLEKGGVKRLAADRLYKAVKAFGDALPEAGAQRAAVLRSVLEASRELADLLGEMGDLYSRGETLRYAAGLWSKTVQLGADLASRERDPALFREAPERLREAVRDARDAYRRVLEAGAGGQGAEAERRVRERMESLDRL